MPIDNVGLMQADDWTQMEGDYTSMRGDNPITIVLRREAEGVASHELTPQTVRVSGFSSRGKAISGAVAEETHGWIAIMGARDLDIYVDDRFTLDYGSFKGLYRVDYVRPNRRAATMAEAQLVE
jgi:hypothetical protein